MFHLLELVGLELLVHVVASLVSLVISVESSCICIVSLDGIKSDLQLPPFVYFDSGVSLSSFCTCIHVAVCLCDVASVYL